MRIESTSVIRSKIYFCESFLFGKKTIDRKTVDFIILSAQGNTGIGECSPLFVPTPDHKEWVTVFERLKNNFLGDSLQEALNTVRELEVRPCMLFAIEMAVCNLFANISGRRWTSLLQNPLSDRTPIQALYWKKRPLAFEDHAALKIKVGRRHIAEDIKLLEHILEKYPHLQIRFDGNRLLSFNQASALVAQTQHLNIVYEELCQQSWRLKDNYNCIIALDESIRDNPDLLSVADQVVVKPQSHEEHWQLQNDVVISSSFETGLGLAYLAQLSALRSPGQPAGIDTQRLLAAPSFVVANGGFVQLERIDQRLRELHQHYEKTKRLPWM